MLDIMFSLSKSVELRLKNVYIRRDMYLHSTCISAENFGGVSNKKFTRLLSVLCTQMAPKLMFGRMEHYLQMNVVFRLLACVQIYLWILRKCLLFVHLVPCTLVPGRNIVSSYIVSRSVKSERCFWTKRTGICEYVGNKKNWQVIERIWLRDNMCVSW